MRPLKPPKIKRMFSTERDLWQVQGELLEAQAEETRRRARDGGNYREPRIQLNGHMDMDQWDPPKHSLNWSIAARTPEEAAELNRRMVAALKPKGRRKAKA